MTKQIKTDGTDNCPLWVLLGAFIIQPVLISKALSHKNRSKVVDGLIMMTDKIRIDCKIWDEKKI